MKELLAMLRPAILNGDQVVGLFNGGKNRRCVQGPNGSEVNDLRLDA